MIYVAVLLSLVIGHTVLDGQAKAEQESTPEVTVTAFCVRGKTKSGASAKDGVAAADVRLFPLGSILQVNGLSDGYDGTYAVLDTGRAVKGQELDIFIADCAAAKRFGRQKARVRMLQRGERSKP